MSHSDDTTPTGNKAYTRDKRAVIGWTGSALGVAAIAISAWAHQKISDHDVQIKGVQVQQANDGQRAAEEKERMDRMDSKLDRILERLPR